MSPDKNFVAELLSWETVMTPAGRAGVCVCVCACRAPLHIQQPAVGAADCGRKQRTLASVVMKPCRPPPDRRTARGGGSAFYIFSDLRGLEKGFF